MLNYDQLIQGENIQTIIKVKPNVSYTRENLKIIGNTLKILDDN